MNLVPTHGVHCSSSLKTKIMELTLSGFHSTPSNGLEMDLGSVEADSPLFFNLTHDNPLDLRLVPVISDRFNERRLGAIKWIMALNMWAMFNLASIPLDAIYPSISQSGDMKPWSMVPNPSVVNLSIKTLLLAVRIMDKFFVAGASASSRQRGLNFNVWKDAVFTEAEDTALLMYSAVCYVLACKMEMSESAPRMVEIYQLMKSWDVNEGLLKGLLPFADMVSSAKTDEVKQIGRVLLARLYASEVMVLQECEWGLGLTTALDVLSEIERETCDDPAFLQVRSLAISNSIRLTMDARYVYNAGFSATRLALCAISEAQLVVDVATPPQPRHSRLTKKHCGSSGGLSPAFDEFTEDNPCWREMDPDALDVGGVGEMDPGLRDVVERYLKKQRVV
jgi:hypothetical protein